MTRIRWVADRDGEAHAHSGARHRTACGKPPVDERHAWPARSRCAACTAAIEKEAAPSGGR